MRMVRMMGQTVVREGEEGRVAARETRVAGVAVVVAVAAIVIVVGAAASDGRAIARASYSAVPG